VLKRFPSTRLVLLSNNGESVRRRQRYGKIVGARERERTRERKNIKRERETECTEISLHPPWLLKLRDEQPQKSGK